MSERTVNGACRFCGQVKMITLSGDEWLERIRKEAVPMVYYQHIKRVSITTPEHGVATMNRSGGNLKIKFTQKHETELTASY